MALANSIEVRDEPARNLARAAIAANAANRDQWITPGPISSVKGRHLDVDEILARSLPAVAQGKEVRANPKAAR
jgi:hypothetical protein